MSGTSKHALYGKAETTYGTFLTGAIQAIRYTSFDVVENTTYAQSNEINASREPTDQIKQSTRVSGSIGFELSTDATLLEMFGVACMRDVAASAVDTNTLTSFAMSQVTNAISDSSANFYAVSGDWVYVSGTANNSNFIAKAASAYISGAYTTLTGTMTAASGVTAGASVVGATSGATGELLTHDTGGKLYSIKVLSGVFAATETVYKFGASGSHQISNITITASGAILSGVKLVTEAANASITVRVLSTVVPGGTKRSWSFEGVQSDLSSVYELYLGCMFTSLTGTVPAKGTVTGSLAIRGATKTIATATAGNGTITAASTNQVMNSESHFYGALMGGGESVLTAMTATDNASPTLCTTANPHGLQTGDLIVIGGNSDSDNNRNWLATRVSSTTFTLQGSSAQTAQSGSAAGYFRKLKVAKAVLDAGFSVDNQLLEETQLGVEGVVAQPLGTLACSGNLNIYFSDLSEQRRHKDDEFTGLALVFQASADPTQIIVFEWPRIKYINNPAPINGNNDSRVNAVQWAAAQDPVEVETFRICY